MSRRHPMITRTTTLCPDTMRFRLAAGGCSSPTRDWPCFGSDSSSFGRGCTRTRPTERGGALHAVAAAEWRPVRDAAQVAGEAAFAVHKTLILKRKDGGRYWD